MTNLQMFKLIASTKALQFKKTNSVFFTADEIDCLKEDVNHFHIVRIEFNAELLNLNVPALKSLQARKLLESELSKIKTFGFEELKIIFLKGYGLGVLTGILLMFLIFWIKNNLVLFLPVVD